jgi:hypothetical protein
MERIHLLIDKLAEQKKNNVPASQMLFTVQLLQTELLKADNKSATLGTAKVAVVMPANTSVYSGKVAERKEALVKELPKQEEIKKPVLVETAVPIEPAKEKITPVPQPAYHSNLIVEQKPKEEPAKVSMNQERRHVPFDAMEETPTLLHQKQKKEVHELIAEKNESLNDRLRQEKKELAHILKDSPVKDLRKAIGVNDRFTFVQDLFRGDEAMYERTIKTINGFNILPEAEYWINRELKVKIGWNDNNEVVQHFYQLVRRRFS